jgi:hypothetical protein
MLKKGRSKSLSDVRCPECGRTETSKDGVRKAKGRTNGYQLWRCTRTECGHRFIERGYRNPAHEACASSLFVGIPVKAKDRAAFFREWADKFKISYRTISRWYSTWWKYNRQLEKAGFERKLLKASRAVQQRVKDDALEVACRSINAEAEYERRHGETLLRQAIRAESGIDENAVNALDGLSYLRLLKIYCGKIGSRFPDTPKKFETVIKRLCDGADWEKVRMEIFQRMPHLQGAYDEALKNSQFAYVQSDPVPYIRPCKK